MTSVVLVTFGRPVEGRLLLTEAIWNRQRNPGGRSERPYGVLLSGLVPASVVATMGSTHHRTRLRWAGCPFARRTGGRLATARRGTETATPASAGIVISPCREGTVAVGFTSGSGGPGFPSRGWFFPTDTPRRPSYGFGQRQPTLDVQGRARNAELPSPT